MPVPLTTPVKASLQVGYSSPRFVLKQGDTLPVVRAQIVSQFGAVNLTGAVVRFRFFPASCCTQPPPEDVRGGVATIENAAKGIVSYEWDDGDTDIAGSYAMDWLIEQGGKQYTAPNDSDIELLILPRP